MTTEKNQQPFSRQHDRAADLLRQAILDVLGDSVRFTTSYVELGVDCTAMEPLTSEQIRKIEGLVNSRIPSDVDGFGFFKITNDFESGDDTRRITGCIGETSYNSMQSMHSELRYIAEATKLAPQAVLDLISSYKQKVIQLEKRIQDLHLTGPIVKEKTQQIQGVSFVSRIVESLDSNDLRVMCDSLKDRIGSGVLCLMSRGSDGAVRFLIYVTKDVVDRGVDASNVAKQLTSRFGGKGGGKEGLSQGSLNGGDDLDAVLDCVSECLRLTPTGI